MKKFLQRIFYGLPFVVSAACFLGVYLAGLYQVACIWGTEGAFIGLMALPIILVLWAYLSTSRETQKQSKAIRDNLPEISKHFQRETKDCSKEYVNLAVQKYQYVEMMHAMGLDKPMHYYNMDQTNCASAELAIIKHSTLFPTENYFQQLSACIEFLSQKEKLLKKVERIQLSVEKYLSQEEINIVSSLSLTCAILEVDEEFFLESDLIVYDPKRDEYKPWRITSHNLTRLLHELQTNPQINEIIAERPVRKPPKEYTVL